MRPNASNWPTPRILAIGYLIAIAALVLNALITFWNLSAIQTTWDTLLGGRDFVRGIDGVVLNLKDAETGQRGYLLTGDARYLEPYETSRGLIPGSLNRLRSLAGQSRSRQGHLDAVAAASAAKLTELEQAITVRRRDGLEAAVAFVKNDEGRVTTERILAEIAALQVEEESTRAPLRTELQEAIRRTTLTFAFVSALALALLFTVHVLSVKSRDELRRHAAWLSTTLRSIGDAVIATDGHGRVMFMNPVAEALTGWPEDQAVGRSPEEVFRIVSEGTRLTVENPVAKVLRDGVAAGLANHTILIARNGTEYAIDDTASPIRDREGGTGLSGVVLVFHDVGNRRKLERELQDRAARLAEDDRRKDEFLAMLAHELRNPLASVGNAIQLLQMPRVPVPDSEWAKDVIERQVKHLARLIDDLLDVSRITRGIIDLRKEKMDASVVIERAVDAVRPLLDERKHDLAVIFKPGTLWCEVDPARLEQTLTNLLSNAAKFTEAGGHIRLTARNDDALISFSVKDDGIGIAPEKLPEMFELFAQGDRTMARSEGGLGIGLTVVKRVVELHGGTVTASSDGPGRGSEFVVKIPALPQPEPVAPRSPDAIPEPRRRARILIVDDNVDTARGLAHLLRLLGNDIRTAFDGASAITEAQAFRPEFILLDLGLPGMDGYQVARQLRSDGFHDVVIIAISGYGQDEDRRRSHEAGFNHHLVKPVNHNALITLIGQPAS
jgi:PAS domain S-box-containing protein